MTYEEIVMCVRDNIEDADARSIFEHIAVQVNIIGEGAGAFYIEVAERKITVEPYDYWDRDGLLTADADTIIKMAKGELSPQKAIEKGMLRIEGNKDKLKLLSRIKY